MRDGVAMLAKHISLNNRALIVVDADADGFCSSAIFMNYFNKLFPHWIQNNVDYFIHDEKQHGLTDVLEKSDWLNKGYKLIIVPDAGSNDYEQHKILFDHQIDCLILDHHEVDKGYSEYACVINNQLSEEYPTKSLCGGAIVYKFCCYFDKIMKTEYVHDFEDLVALALISDMMDQKDFETHELIKIGLQNIKNPFFVEMMNRQKYQFEGGITPIGIAFYITPYINAMTRSGTMDEKQLMFEAMLDWRSDELIPSTKRGCKGQVEPRHEQAGRTCVNVKSRQKRSQDASLEYVEQLIEDENLLSHKILAVKVDAGKVDKNLAGLIANQLASKYARPTLILRICEDEDGSIIYSGSGRNYGRSRLEDFREFCNKTNLIQFAQGHASAFGIAIKESQFEEFINVTDALLADFNFDPCYFVDLEVTADELSDNEVFSIGSNADIWGQGLDEPLIAITNIKIDSNSIQYMGQNKDTLKLTFPGRKTTMLKFRIKEEEKELLNPKDGILVLTAIGKCTLNHYMGNVTPQVLLEDFEITHKSRWDF